MNDSQSSVRIGPISLFALIAVICLATLAVLSIATSNATYRLTTLQADSMAQQYHAETAAQTFVARIDARYADATVTAERAAAQRAAAEKAAAELAARTGQSDESSSAPAASPATAGDPAATTQDAASTSAITAAGSLASALPTICDEAAAATDDVIEVSAELDGSTITAQFTCPSGRVLDIELELGSGGTYRITKWNMTAKVNSAETDTLWSGM